ncbi:DUF6318 family protein [Pseudokineococcus sp. 1T1Z-3]|uniref:DUF6318 family protein n=1 Tax=Pseudokineococcus sp. 1T1Z-3 TaxID=3132745 RepID=UPI0030AA1006
MRRSGPLALLAAAALTLSGCISEPEPGAPMPTSAAPAPTTSLPPEASTAPDPAPTETAPTLPPEATTNDAAGAEAFVRHWYDTLNYAYRTNDTGPLEAASRPDCEVCNSFVEDFDNLPAGHRIDGGQVEVIDSVAPAPDGTGNVLVALATRQEASRVIDANGDVVGETEGEDIALGAVIVRVDGGWLMYGLGE